MSQDILVAGWQKQSLIDYPGKVASVIFLAGCNMRCHYCHNPQLWSPQRNQIKLTTVMAYLRAHQHLLDAVVISGGEPTCAPNLLKILRQLRSLSLLIKLDTNGTHPQLLKKIIAAGLIDYVALDVKATPAKYPTITGMPITQVLTTMAYLRQQTAVTYMLRTTITPKLNIKDLITMGKTLIAGAPIWQLQQCRIKGAYSAEKVQKMVPKLQKYTQHIVLIGV